MDLQLKNKFTALWKKYFADAELPITFYYSNNPENIDPVKPPTGHSCIIGALSRVRKGADLCFKNSSLGCGSIVQFPYLEKNSDSPRSIPGMFDVSARPFVPERVLSFAIPMNKFFSMVETMEENFLITGSWGKVRNRISLNVHY